MNSGQARLELAIVQKATPFRSMTIEVISEEL
jgi:hypothetical protein